MCATLPLFLLTALFHHLCLFHVHVCDTCCTACLQFGIMLTGLFFFSFLSCVCVFQIFQSDYQKYHGDDTPSWCACQLTLEVFHEPVVTPCGISYEQGALMEHLNKVGSFDPVTRRPMTAKDIRKNVGLRNAVESYLNDNPWAWEHAM